MLVEFNFSNIPELSRLQTMIVLDTRGAKVQVQGLYKRECGHSVPVLHRFVVTGTRGQDSPVMLGWVEDMLRQGCTRVNQKAWESARDLTTHVARVYSRENHKCSIKMEDQHG